MSQITSQGVMLTPGAAQKTADTCRRVLNIQGPRSNQHPGNPGLFTPFYAQLTGSNSSNGSSPTFSWQQMQLSAGVFTTAAFSDSNFSAGEINKNVGFINQIVTLTFAGYNASNSNLSQYVFTGIAPYATFDVKVNQSGGSNGSQTTLATFTYYLFSLADNSPIGSTTSPYTPTWARANSAGILTPGTRGKAYVDASGNVHLTQVDEQLQMTGC